MQEHKLYIKNMVCDRCKLVVRQEFEKINIPLKTVELGEVTLSESASPQQLDSIKTALQQSGFELIDDKKSQLIEKIKTTIVEFIHHGKGKSIKTNYSDYLAQQIGKDYSSLSSLFSDVEGVTIEHYIINQKIERVKELLVYDELTISEIAHQLGYSSVAHLSSQFKKVTGLTPSHFKTIKDTKRKPLDKV